VPASKFYPLIDYAQLSLEEVSFDREIYKGHGYRLHAAKMLGKVVAMMVYEGKRAREVSFTLMNHIQVHSDCFVEAMLGSSQIQPERYVRCRSSYSTMIWN